MPDKEKIEKNSEKIAEIDKNISVLNTNVMNYKKQHSDKFNVVDKEITALDKKYDDKSKEINQKIGEVKKQNAEEHKTITRTLNDLKNNTNLLGQEVNELIQQRNKISTTFWKLVLTLIAGALLFLTTFYLNRLLSDNDNKTNINNIEEKIDIVLDIIEIDKVKKHGSGKIKLRKSKP